MAGRPRVLVTGADQHQGLAVIRGLGLADIPVIACGAAKHSLGFYSRFAVNRGRYTSPFESLDRFIGDILSVVRRTGAEIIIPAVESTLVGLNEARELVEQYATLAAPPPEILEYAIDKSKTLSLAERLGVPIPQSVHGGDPEEILARAAALRFPVAVKPRGHRLHLSTANRLGFKVRYASSPQELRSLLWPLGDDARALLVQEYVPGTGRCVAGVWRHGEPIALFAYARAREFPLSGGVSVLRKSIPAEEPLVGYATALLSATRWHGIAMVEFKYDERSGRYTLMEINGRFQASTALSLDAGLNLPLLVVQLFSGRETCPVNGYRVGVEERWLRGDLLALRNGLQRNRWETPGSRAAPSRLRLAWHILRDFRPGMKYDEFKRYDWKPGVVEFVTLLGMILGWARDAVIRPALHLGHHAAGWVSAFASSRAQRSIRA